jgi:hypothetical protein
MLAQKIPGALILWRGPDGLLFSVDAGTPVKGFAPAGPNALEEPIVHSRDYYIGGRPYRRVSLDEALVQALIIDPANPRIQRLFQKRAASGSAARRRLVTFAEKYRIGKWHSANEIGKFKFDWEGGLSEFVNRYTAVELQHKASDWR